MPSFRDSVSLRVSGCERTFVRTLTRAFSLSHTNTRARALSFSLCLSIYLTLSFTLSLSLSLSGSFVSMGFASVNRWGIWDHVRDIWYDFPGGERQLDKRMREVSLKPPYPSLPSSRFHAHPSIPHFLSASFICHPFIRERIYIYIYMYVYICIYIYTYS